MKKNKIIITLFLFTVATGSFPRLCLGQAVTANQGIEAGKQLVQDVMDFSMLANQGTLVIKRTEHAIEQLKVLKNKERKLINMMSGIGFKAYKDKYKDTGFTKQQMDQMKIKIVSTGYLLQSIISLGGVFAKRVIDVGSSIARSNYAVMSDVIAAASFATASGGISTIVDTKPMVNAVTLLKGDVNKENLKRFLFEVIYMLDQVEKNLDEIYNLLNGATAQVTYFNNAGQMITAMKKYLYRNGGYTKPDQFDVDKQRKKREKERKAQEKLKKVKEKVLAGKTFPK